MMAETKTSTFGSDFVALMAAIPVMPKDASNPFFKSKYTPLDTIVEVVTPILAKYNFSWTSKPSFNDLGEPSLKYALVHMSGERDEGEVKLLLKSSDPQGQGSAITYARRYAITSQLNIVSDADDDGNAARQAADAAKTIDPPSPEEPSVQVDEDLGKKKEDKIALVKHMNALLKAAGHTTPDEAEWVYLKVLGKKGPTNAGEIKEVIKSLENPDGQE